MLAKFVNAWAVYKIQQFWDFYKHEGIIKIISVIFFCEKANDEKELESNSLKEILENFQRI